MRLLLSICLWVAAVTLAVSVGANLFQALVIDRVWSASPPESVRAFVSGPFPSLVKGFHTSPILLPGMLCLVASPFLAWNIPPMRPWLLSALAIQLVITLVTFLYFWPMNRVLLMGGAPNVDAATIIAMTHRWLFADRLRLVFRFAAFLCLLRAMVLSGAAVIGQ